MPATIITPLRSPALSKDDNFVTFSTTLPTATTRPGFLITGVAADGDELNLRWGTSVARMTFATAPDLSGTQIRAANGQVLADYLPQLMEGLLSVPRIEAAFVVRLTDDGVRLELRDALEGDLNATSSASLTVSIFNPAAAAGYPNLSCGLSLYKVGEANPILRAKAAYNPEGKTEFNLGNILNVQLGLPDLSPASYAAEEPGGMQEYFFRYADQYGRPPQPETLTKSATFVAVAGGSNGATLLRWGSQDPQLCHAYFDDGDVAFAKPVSPTQKDWCWFYVDGSATIRPSIIVIYDDGTAETQFLATSQTFTRGLYCFPSGPSQVSFDTLNFFATKEVRRYIFRVRSDGPRITYDLRQECAPREQVIAYENGAGGIETVSMYGKTEHRYSSSAQRFNRARPQVQGGDKGATQRYQTEGRRQWRLRTGYISEAYARHLRQVLLGRCWLIDPVKGFVEVLPDGGSLSLTKDDDDLHALELSFTAASPDKAAHNL